ncbi:MAG: GNAT family N-acetyltransferase [Alphaproteobacteria bacterium]|nr:GNAT family N-acetyltransferase [Rhodospirillaceae bacterium]MBT6205097.1 GNAT family N-acetyltransferase [Rhodospirillaceae bacterium]MBT6510408.1 GNAT family N-acetyltransferase [Rhodospirillaceae bacterium]MBT7645757.1 GNAT family N-acetyltransferase [Rhodospirillaceae bacterium]MDG2479617.1 GNAT family N-acetyltransferase [Alphaproteobacteria bacterium]
MAIRSASNDDLIAIEDCAREAYTVYVPRIGKVPAPMVADFESQIERGQIHISTDMRGALTGYIVFYPRDGHMHLENVAVDPTHHGKGIGRGSQDGFDRVLYRKAV